MKKNLILILAIGVVILLIFNSARRILSFNSTAQKVEDEEARLLQLQQENEALKQELEYKKTQRFQEEEIRNKLGLVKEGEEVFVVPDDKVEEKQDGEKKKVIPNWKKWQILIFGRG